MSICGRCGGLPVGRPGVRWCPCGWSEDALVGGSAAVEEPRPVRRRDLHSNIGRRWTPGELAFLFRHRDRMSLRALAGRLERSPHAIEQKLHKLGWRKKRHGNGGERVQGRPGTRWSEGEILSVLPGSTISGSLRRTREAIRRRLRREGEALRSCDGMMSAADVARAYSCPVSRVLRMRELGVLPGVWRFNSWRFDPGVVEGVRGDLEAPKSTWKSSEPDVADYAQRYDLRRVRVDGRPGGRVPRGGGGRPGVGG